MIIVTTYDLLTRTIGQHFGECKHFLVYDSETKNCKVVDNGGNSHRELIGYIKGLGANTFLCGGIGRPAVGFLNEEKIEVVPGCVGNALECCEAYVNNTLNSNPNMVHECGSHHHH